MSHDHQRFIIISGGPGSGKSTLIDALENKGFARTVEAGRAIIQHQVKIDGQALPWVDRALFAELMLSWEMRSYELAHHSKGPVFFDRGIPDVIGYLTLCALPVSEHVRRAALMIRYNRTVFLAPPWEEIFGQDSERKQDFDEAVRTFRAMEQAYRDLGYEIALLPISTVQERVNFIRKTLPSDFF
ncbi:AAA family ATPase [Brucella thiophenivorans]|uniref:AAA domain protein n=1 Tax=Brucella thiophenivorans TaxID=571255 RepID=A0A256FZL4_9HYPH|nr:AAA family ATPase [Brucella thiophenivorans]OYR20284.1 AAA domain protein [Brucella thiophenivorans]